MYPFETVAICDQVNPPFAETSSDVPLVVKPILFPVNQISFNKLAGLTILTQPFKISTDGVDGVEGVEGVAGVVGGVDGAAGAVVGVTGGVDLVHDMYNVTIHNINTIFFICQSIHLFV